MDELRMIARYLVHAPIQQNDMWIVIRTPQMLVPSVTIRGFAVSIDLPVIDSIHRVRILLFRRHLELAPDEVLQVILDGFNFLRVWIDRILRRDVWGFAQTGIVAGQDVVG